MVEFSRERERERKIGSHRVGMQRRRKEGRKEASWRLPVSAASPICLTASRVSRLQLHVLYSRVSMAFSLWYLLFGCPCPCLGTPSGSVSTRELPLSLSLFLSVSFCGEVPAPPSRRRRDKYIHRTIQRRAYLHTDGTSCVSTSAFEGAACRATRGRTRGSRATKTQTESWHREREREREREGRRVIVKPWHSGFIFW